MQLIQELLSLPKFPFQTVSESEFQPLDMGLFEAEESKSVVFMKCPLFDKTLKKHPEVNKALAKFLKQKQSDPMQPFGSKDRAFTGDDGLKKFIHAGLNFDVSLIYTKEGKKSNGVQTICDYVT